MTSLIDNTRRPDVTFHSSGRIDITAGVVKTLGLSPGDIINVATDGYEYLLYVQTKADKVIGCHRGQVYPTNKSHNHFFRTHSRKLCEAVFKVVRGAGLSGQVRLPVGQAYHSKELDKMVVPLITRNPL